MDPVHFDPEISQARGRDHYLLYDRQLVWQRGVNGTPVIRTSKPKVFNTKEIKLHIQNSLFFATSFIY